MGKSFWTKSYYVGGVSKSFGLKLGGVTKILWLIVLFFFALLVYRIVTDTSGGWGALAALIPLLALVPLALIMTVVDLIKSSRKKKVKSQHNKELGTDFYVKQSILAAAGLILFQGYNHWNVIYQNGNTPYGIVKAPLWSGIYVIAFILMTQSAYYLRTSPRYRLVAILLPLLLIFFLMWSNSEINQHCESILLSSDTCFN